MQGQKGKYQLSGKCSIARNQPPLISNVNAVGKYHTIYVKKSQRQTCCNTANQETDFFLRIMYIGI